MDGAAANEVALQAAKGEKAKVAVAA
ncbi:uncharacterized protein METZ01_LOCUS213504 [marine metagenome]|uniref:Uncharacterized protein n=1 Tax=marine metagenome TaxID=408172 RepID=A0A382FCL4_9ZZZZ